MGLRGPEAGLTKVFQGNFMRHNYGRQCGSLTWGYHHSESHEIGASYGIRICLVGLVVLLTQLCCLAAKPKPSNESPKGQDLSNGTPAVLQADSQKEESLGQASVTLQTSRRKPGPFIWISFPKWQAQLRAEGGLFYHIAYEDKKKVLEKLQANTGSNKRKVGMMVCKLSRVGQDDMIRMFARVVDDIAVWAFTHPGRTAPKTGEVLWPGYDNPYVNRLRELRAVAAGCRLWAETTDGLNGIEDRKISFEEIQWLTFAAIGADFDGVVWDVLVSEKNHKKLERIGVLLLKHADQLGAAVPIKCVKEGNGLPVSALRSDKKLFIILLNPGYMKLDSSGKKVVVPLAPVAHKIDLTINLPGGVAIRSGTSLSGKRVKLDSGEGQIHVKHRLKGGGDMLIFDLTRDNADKDKHPSAKTERNNQ